MKKVISNNLNCLRSPSTYEGLIFKDGCLQTSSKIKHAIINDIPILVKHPLEVNTTPPPSQKISQNIPEYIVPYDLPKDALILHLGSGNVLSKDDRVISLDILPCENVDIVGEAENLPFKDGVFDFIDSCAVFEHVHNPLIAINEVKRVLKPNGFFRIDNSFMQSYHGFPSHYFNMTCQANETYLVDDFQLMQSAIPESGTPIQTLSMLMDRFLENVSKETMEKVNQMKLPEFLNLLKSDLTSNNILMSSFSDYSKRAMAATHVVVARKPLDYTAKLHKIKADKFNYEMWEISKRDYYSERTAVQLRYHEIFFYKRLCIEQGKQKENRVNEIKLPQSLDIILEQYECKDFFDIQLLNESIENLKKQEHYLKFIRDEIISVYLNSLK